MAPGLPLSRRNHPRTSDQAEQADQQIEGHVSLLSPVSRAERKRLAKHEVPQSGRARSRALPPGLTGKSSLLDDLVDDPSTTQHNRNTHQHWNEKRHCSVSFGFFVPHE
jgi:hypothetical protein